MTKEQNQKNILRVQWKNRRDAISSERRKTASTALMSIMLPLLAHANNVLSYMSIQSELDTTQLNTELAKTNRLILPKVEENEIKLFKIHDLENDLKKGAFSIQEPDSSLCKAIPTFLVDVALIPAIAFDAAKHRLGYGKGIYDRFLAEHGKQFDTIGIGFEEQLSNELFPIEKHDICLTRIVLV